MGNSKVPEGSLFMALAMFAFSFLGVGMVVKMRARTKPRTGQHVEMGLLDEKIHSAEVNLCEGIRKFGDKAPESSLSETTSAGLDHQISF